MTEDKLLARLLLVLAQEYTTGFSAIRELYDLSARIEGGQLSTVEDVKTYLRRLKTGCPEYRNAAYAAVNQHFSPIHTNPIQTGECDAVLHTKPIRTEYDRTEYDAVLYDVLFTIAYHAARKSDELADNAPLHTVAIVALKSALDRVRV